MKKLVQFIILSLLIFSIVSAETRNNELNNLFKLLKNSENTKAIEIENKIWKIWSTHPSEDRRGYRLTELLAQGSLLINQRKLIVQSNSTRNHLMFNKHKIDSIMHLILS